MHISMRIGKLMLKGIRKPVRWVLKILEFSRLRRANFLITFALLNFIVGLASYNQKLQSLPLDVSANNYLQDATFETLLRQAEVLCPKNEEDGFCDAPCWNGVPYQEPNFVISPNCTEYSSKELLIYVYTSFGNREERASIREQFKKYTKYSSNISASLMFVIGFPSDRIPVRKRGDLAKAIQSDHKTHGDILQIDIPDTYINLGFKGIAALKWVSQCGESTKYLAKIDDDASHVLDMNALFMSVNRMEIKKNETDNKLVCLGVFYNQEPHAPKFKKRYHVSFHHYFDKNYPPYCQGTYGTFMNRQVALSLYKAAKGKPIFQIDDVYMTGLLRQRACVKVADWSGFYRFMVQLVYRVLQYNVVSYHFFSKDYERYLQAQETEYQP